MNEAEPAVPGARTDDRWRLDDRVALVTGASAGLGARFARLLHAAGAHVIATARRATCADIARMNEGADLRAMRDGESSQHRR